MTRAELHASPEYKRQVEALRKLSAATQRKMADDIERNQRELDSLRAAQHSPYAMFNAAWQAQLKESQQWLQRVEAVDTNAAIAKMLKSVAGQQILSAFGQDCMRRTIDAPAPKPRRAITNSQLPRLNKHYRWVA